MSEETTKFKSIRLNSSSRNDILKSFLKQFETNYFTTNHPGVASSASELQDRINDIKYNNMKALWLRAYGRHIDTLKKLPDFFIASQEFKAFAEDGRACAMTLKGMPGKGNAADIQIPDEDWTELWSLHSNMQRSKGVFEKERDALKQEIWNLLESIGSTKQLLEVWPAAEPFLPAYLADPERGIKLPALHISRLEERLLLNKESS